MESQRLNIFNRDDFLFNLGGKVKKILSLSLMFLCLIVNSQTINIKIASPAPENTPWGEELRRIATAWEKTSQGKVKVTIFAGGVGGEEDAVIKKMKIGQFQGVALTTYGLMQYDKSLLDFSAPGLYRSTEEIVYVIEKLKSRIVDNFRKNKAELVLIGMGGWAYMFSKLDITTPEVARRSKFASSANASDVNTILKNMGYNIVPIQASDTLMSLNGGTIESYLSSPILVAVQQLFGISKYMLDVPIAPFLSGLVIDSRTWNKIPADLQKQFIAIASQSVNSIQSKSIVLETDAVKTMQKYGLIVLKTTEEQKQQWRQEFEKGMNLSTGTTVDAELLAEINTILQEYRKGK